jgi:hypothetical protein
MRASVNARPCCDDQLRSERGGRAELSAPDDGEPIMSDDEPAPLPLLLPAGAFLREPVLAPLSVLELLSGVAIIDGEDDVPVEDDELDEPVPVEPLPVLLVPDESIGLGLWITAPVAPEPVLPVLVLPVLPVLGVLVLPVPVLGVLVLGVLVPLVPALGVLVLPVPLVPVVGLLVLPAPVPVLGVPLLSVLLLVPVPLVPAPLVPPPLDCAIATPPATVRQTAAIAVIRRRDLLMCLLL